MKKLFIFAVIVDILVAICFLVTYKCENFKNTIIASAMGTKTHQWIAYTFYSPEEIQKVMAAEAYIPFDENTNLNDIVIDTAEKTKYDNEYDEQVLTRNEGNDLYKIIPITVGGKYQAWITVIYDPSKVQLMHSKVFNQNDAGLETVESMARRYGAVVGINGGGFLQHANSSSSDVPAGYVIKNNKVIWSLTNKQEDLIGISNDNKLMLVHASGQEAVDMGMRDGIQFGPFLIVNGKRLEYVSNGGGYSRASRTAIAQRKDGIILFFSTKGYRHGFEGITMNELIDVLLKYGAYNAANLDGGTSTTMVLNGRTYNSPMNDSGELYYYGRLVVTAWGLIP